MANNDILQYLRKTPHNTNVNVVKGMLGNESGSGAIEITTVFDEDITLYASERQYLPVAGMYDSTDTIEVNVGYLRFTWDDITFAGFVPMDNNLMVILY